MKSRIRLGVMLALTSLIWPFSFFAEAQNSGGHFDVGIVYYTDGGTFKPLKKEVVTQSGRSSYTGKIKGAHATIRLQPGQPQIFRVCGADPTRFKLYRFKSTKNQRSVTIAKNNMWIGGSKLVLSESEIPLTIQDSGGGCFALKPQVTLGDGEFGFSPVDSQDSFMFGVGDAKDSN